MDSKADRQDLLFYLLPLIHSNAPSFLPLLLALGAVLAAAVAIFRWTSRGGCAWADRSSTIPGPRGLPVLGSLLEMGDLAHHRLRSLSIAHGARKLMALSLGSTRVVITSAPEVAREILTSAAFADRPLKQSAAELLFGRAIGFAPYGDYWRGLRRIAANHLFSPRRIAAHEPQRQRHTEVMIDAIASAAGKDHGKSVGIRGFLQRASLANVMQGVFGRCYSGAEEAELQAMVREGFELLGAFNWSDHLPLLRAINVDPHSIQERCSKLVPRVQKFVQAIIDEHRQARSGGDDRESSDFVDVLLNLSGEEKLQDQDMIAVLWEMIFRGTDTTAILTEWMLAELVLHPEIQRRLYHEIEELQSKKSPPSPLSDQDVARMPLLQAVVKETLRLHPPGPLLSWARLSTQDVTIAGHHVPRGTTAMVNMWAITHDPAVWSEPELFVPDRFLGVEFDVKGTDLRLAPFGAGRRVCPGRALGLATVGLWLAKLVERFEFVEDKERPVDLSEVLKLSCEMVNPLSVGAVERCPIAASS
ncbi:cytochrome P450 78A4 [Selaginella moellendorffii]|nr:cytochrome P450 78A4 [Selaginella moellendorffii]|eukprot:XP_002961803.2 cytochrome P450 78A4 [Selaginella moellendorffii]